MYLTTYLKAHLLQLCGIKMGKYQFNFKSYGLWKILKIPLTLLRNIEKCGLMTDVTVMGVTFGGANFF